MNRLWILLMALVFIMPNISMGQEVMKFSLEEAQAYAVENNSDIQNATTEIEIARKKVKETTAIGLPQINAGASYNDFIDIPTQLIPGEFFGGEPGSFIPVQFGTKYNMSMNAEASQLIFSGEYIVGLQASKTFVKTSQRQQEKVLIDLEQKVAESYYLVLIAARNKVIIDSTLVTLKEIQNANIELYENGFIEETDVDQVTLLLNDLDATLLDITNNLQVSKNLLKFQMGLQLENQIELTDKLDNLMDKLDQDVLFAASFDYTKNIDYKILENQQELALLNLKRNKSLYLPSLYGFFSFSKTAQRDSWNFMQNDGDWRLLEQDQGWYNTTLWGIQLDIPIWSSGSRSAKVQQAKLQIDQLEVVGKQVKTGLEIEFSTRQNSFLNAWKVYHNKKTGLDLSWKIYQKTKEKQLEGVSSSIELQQNYNQYLASESTYVMAMLDLLQSKLNLERMLTETN
jgi:outer membrane protein TolC